MIWSGTTNGDSNRAKKRFSQEKCMVVEEPTSQMGLVLGFGPQDLERIVVPHNDALIIRTTVDNFDIA